MYAFTAPTRRTLGICDRCGQAYKLTSLKPEYVLGKDTGVKVCRTCWDCDHPQNYVGLVNASDPQTLQDPRPEDNTASRAMEGPSFEELLEGVP